MKAIVYSTQLFEKEYLAKANGKKHDITLISNPLSLDTASFAEGKDAVVVFTNDDVSASVIEKLKRYSVRYIATRSVGTDHIDKVAAEAAKIKVANIPAYSPESIAEHAVGLILALNRNLLHAAAHAKNFDFRLDGLLGFTLKGKVVGLVGLGNIALALATILKGFGCKLIAYDPFQKHFPEDINKVSLTELYREADIISLHAPLTEKTKHMINTKSLSLMKSTAMLINTARGALIDTNALLHALENHTLGYYGADVFEYEKGLFFEDHHKDKVKDALLTRLLAQPNVLITPHQGFLTQEALQEIASETIHNLDQWQAADQLINGTKIKANI
ncbi:D-lactate dehydrogenase [Pedobacter sp. UYP30]|uniref:2-hydroxyacid dehydrogenase n=1 Tax=Pedobacter sp. UYP30 TaxID=1756400 RepID=UPI0033979486